MNNLIESHILDAWNLYAGYLSYALIGLGLAISLFCFVREIGLGGSYKKLYDFVSQHEIMYLWRSALFLIIGTALLISTLTEGLTWMSFGILMLVDILTTALLVYGAHYALKFYYPFRVEKRLLKLRYKPRISPDGRKMKLLNEEEEDLYLDEGMQAEEDVFSTDYDVWVDEISGYTHTERYSGKLFAEECPKCHYKTMKTDREEVTTPPTQTQKGILKKYSKCGYCGHKESKTYTLARLTALS